MYSLMLLEKCHVSSFDVTCNEAYLAKLYDEDELTITSAETEGEERVRVSSPGEQSTTSEDNLDLAFRFRVRDHAKKQKFWISFLISATWEEASGGPFRALNIGVEGVFSFRRELSKDEIGAYVPLLCLVNLHGIARGAVAQATALFPGGPFYLPLVDMKEVLRNATSEPASNDAGSSSTTS